MSRVQEWMTMAVVQVESTAPIERAKALLREHDVHQLPVVDADRLVGIVTDRDLRDATPRALATSDSSGAPLDVILVRDVMTAPVVAIHPQAPVSVAAIIMKTEGFGALPVAVDGELLGIITRSDILQSVVSHILGPRRSPIRAVRLAQEDEATVLN
jgi:acetoin utilization protein AcuB